MTAHPAPSQCPPGELRECLGTLFMLAFNHFCRGSHIWNSQEFDGLTISARFRKHLGGRGNSLELLLAPAGLRVSAQDISAIKAVVKMSIVREETLPLNRKAQALYFLCDNYALQLPLQTAATGSSSRAS